MPGSPDGQRGAGAARWARWRRIALMVLAGGLLTAIIVISRHTLLESITTLGHLDWVWFVAAIGFEAVSLTAFGLSRRRLLRAEGHRATFGSVMAVTYAGNALSMSLPFAGTQLAAVFTYRQFRRHGVGSAVTGWALAVSAILSTSALALILVAGAFASGASATTAAGFGVAALFVMPALVVLLALRYGRFRAALHRFIARWIRVSQRLFRGRPQVNADGAEEFLDRVASIKLPVPRYAEVFVLAVVNWAADCGCLACAVLATGAAVPWHGLVVAYGAGAAVGSTGVTPGGFGIVELTLTAALAAVGLGASRAFAAVLTYRLINFWLILIGGWISMIVLTHRNKAGDEVDSFGTGRCGPRADAGQAPLGGPRPHGMARDQPASDDVRERASESVGKTGPTRPGDRGPGQLTQARQGQSNEFD